MSLPNFRCWNLMDNVVVLRDATFKRLLGHEDFSVINEIKALIKEAFTQHSSLCLSVFWQVRTYCSSWRM
jgi:hypothetical protein